VKAERTGRGRFERLVEFARTRRFGLITVGVIGVVVIALVVSGPPEDDKSSEAQTVSTPTEIPLSSDTAGIALPMFVPGSEEADTKPSTRKGGAKAVKMTGPKLLRRPHDLAFAPGTIAKAVLVTGASNDTVKAALTDPVTVNGEELVEAGAVLLGTGQSSEDRLFIRFDKLLFDDGSMQTIDAEAVDSSDKTPGLKGSRVGAYATKIAGSIGLNFISGMADGLQETDTNGFVAVKKPTVKNALLNGASRAAVEESTDLMSSLKSNRPVIAVPEGTHVYVMFAGDH
jgi:hypothetical protein